MWVWICISVFRLFKVQDHVGIRGRQFCRKTICQTNSFEFPWGCEHTHTLTHTWAWKVWDYFMLEGCIISESCECVSKNFPPSKPIAATCIHCSACSDARTSSGGVEICSRYWRSHGSSSSGSEYLIAVACSARRSWWKVVPLLCEGQNNFWWLTSIGNLI